MCVFWVDYLSHSLSCFQCAAKGQLRCEITASLAVDANNEMHVIFNVNWWCFAWHTVVDAVAAFNITIWYYVVVVGFFAVIRCLNFLLFFTSILDIFASIHRKCSICRKIASDEQKNWNEEKSTSKNKRSMLNSFIDEFLLHTNIIKLKMSWAVIDPLSDLQCVSALLLVLLSVSFFLRITF